MVTMLALDALMSFLIDEGCKEGIHAYAVSVLDPRCRKMYNFPHKSVIHAIKFMHC